LGVDTLSQVNLLLGECRYRSETLSTLRFGERAKLMPNKAMINEISEDDVNGLSDQIRQLKVLPQE
jgi:kinesin family protein 15